MKQTFLFLLLFSVSLEAGIELDYLNSLRTTTGFSLH